MLTSEWQDIVLNAVALAFVLEVDDLVAQVFLTEKPPERPFRIASSYEAPARRVEDPPSDMWENDLLAAGTRPSEASLTKVVLDG